eukprot:gnl/MRDRNA2_/MRDRNA2_72728_c0_seq1.p1 gnl/MRDRNA2_/MRDRNA2_72728_c0~~gnl/MRDRNA2_/MRDRNA2_72728_c0_seq1.p1  ORF type:complete len:386 (-),score=96.41 gnl/MRDRNA2_/MRDRNA2_72728_c0_seq1:22-1179(-)
MRPPKLSPPGSPGMGGALAPGGIGGPQGLIGGNQPFRTTAPALPKPAPLGVAFAGQSAPGMGAPLGMGKSQASSASSYVERASINLVEVVQKRLDVLNAEKLRLQSNTKDPRAPERIAMVEAEMKSVTEDPEYISALNRLETAAGQRAAVARRKQLLEVLSSGQQHLREVQQQVREAESRQSITSGPLIQGAIAEVHGQIEEQNRLLVSLKHHVEGMEIAMAHSEHRLLGHEKTNKPQAQGLQETQLRLKEGVSENAELRQRVVTIQEELAAVHASKKKREEDSDHQVALLKQSIGQAQEKQAALRRRLADLANQKQSYIKESTKAVGAADMKYQRLFGDIEDLEVQVGLRPPPDVMIEGGETNSTARNQPTPPGVLNPFRGVFD